MTRLAFLLIALAFTLTLFGDPSEDRSAFKAKILSLHEAAFHGDREAKAEIKKLKASHKGEEGDYLNVFELIAKAENAKRPDEYTLLDIGQAYNFGRGGLEIDKKQAAYWYARAARAGSKIAIYNLGIAYFRGNHDVPKDWTLAQGLLQAADALTLDGDKNSIWTLAAMAKEEEDYTRAFFLFSRLGPKEPYGFWEAAQLAESGKVADLEDPQRSALELYTQAGKSGFPRGLADAGRLSLLSSDPKTRDPAKALSIFADLLEQEPLDGSARSVVENALLPTRSPRPDETDAPISQADLLDSAGYQELMATAQHSEELSKDWKRFNRALSRIWPESPNSTQ